jgi:hypothetical protein
MNKRHETHYKNDMDDKVIALFKNYDMNRKEGERGRESLPQ